MKDELARDAWAGLARWTPARIALGRVGVSVPTGATLEFGMAHARARDAIHTPLDVAGLAAELRDAGFATDAVTTRTLSRAEYLLRPDLGRRLSAASREAIVCDGAAGRLTVVMADGLSALAPRRHAVPLLVALRQRLIDWTLDTVFIATQARVAVGDEIGELRGAEAVLVLIGERPGLQASDSLGAYLTYAPRVGCSDAERNCVSNVRVGGLGYEEAAGLLGRLLEGARRLGGSGVGLKDEGEEKKAYLGG
ncbi:ethanolamine ammonia-lyase subunit EutC [Granulicella sp. WH15]|uniref:ethanolamine ammonia-lyase subunit EutC n=1 Tax=Granulicella sp. WH15 TaxID=2602070 RepID=UPI001366D8E4|nr:ethanolamine ammonia-lyase subunit EutC [Granulicella sp. WH15]QHN02529.1 ethanolamine ammonia-lyase subunit EutC [Granulicella sp. WH15]